MARWDNLDLAYLAITHNGWVAPVKEAVSLYLCSDRSPADVEALTKSLASIGESAMDDYEEERRAAA